MLRSLISGALRSRTGAGSSGYRSSGSTPTGAGGLAGGLLGGRGRGSGRTGGSPASGGLGSLLGSLARRR